MRRPPSFSLLLVAVGCVLVVLAEAAPAAASSALAGSTLDLAPTAVLGAASFLMMTVGAVSMVRRRRGTPRDRTDP